MIPLAAILWLWMHQGSGLVHAVGCRDQPESPNIICSGECMTTRCTPPSRYQPIDVPAVQLPSKGLPNGPSLQHVSMYAGIYAMV